MAWEETTCILSIRSATQIRGQLLIFFLPISSDYIQIRQPVYLSHTAGRYAAKRFRKAQCPIIERLTNSLMMNGRNSGKKLMAMRIVSHAFDIVRLSQPDTPFEISTQALIFSLLFRSTS
jgi:hypothetical protein